MEELLIEKEFNTQKYYSSLIFPNEEGKVIQYQHTILVNNIPRLRELFEDAKKQMPNEGCVVIEITDVESVAFVNFLRYSPSSMIIKLKFEKSFSDF